MCSDLLPHSESAHDAPEANGTSPSAIEFRNVTKAYKLYKNDKQRFLSLVSNRVPHHLAYANRDISFSIARGEAVSFFGRNGAGKSTILKMISGVAFPTEGEIVVNGRVSALLELGAGFDAHFTGRENIYLRGHILGLRDQEIAAVEESIVDFASLGEYIDQPIRTYSSGMKARLGFACAVSINPEIVVIDEALSVGDKAFQKKCNARVREIISQDHVTVLFVTHSPNAARDFCTRGIVLDQGSVLFDGPIAEASAFYDEMIAKTRGG